MACDDQRAAGAQTAPGPHRARHRAGRHLHCGDLRPHRHPPQHLQHVVRQHLPERRLPGARRGAIRQRRHRHPQSRRRVPRLDGARRSGRGGCRGIGHRVRPVHRARWEGHHDGRRADPRVRFRPQSGALAIAAEPRQSAHDAQPGGDGPRDGPEVPLQGGAAGPHSARGPDEDVHHHGPGTLRDGQQPGRRHPRRLRHADGPGIDGRRRQIRQHQRHRPAGRGQGDGATRHCAHPPAR